MKNPNNQGKGFFSETERYRVVWFLGWAAVIINLVMLVVQTILGQVSLQSLTVQILFILSLLVTMLLVKRHHRYGVELFFLMVEVLIPMIIYSIGDTRTSAVMIYIMVIFIMGLLEGRRGIIASTIVSSLSLSSVGYLLYGRAMFTGELAAAFASQNFTFIFTGLLAFVVDLTLYSNQFELFKYKNLVDQSPLSMVIFDTTGTVQYVNEAFTGTTGFSLEEARHISAHDFTLSTLTKPKYDEFWKTIRSGKTWVGEVVSTTKFGKTYYEKLIIRPIINSQGQTIYFTAINENIDNRKRAEIALQKAHSDVEEKLAEIIRLKNTLQEQIIHDSLTGLYNRRFFNEVIDRELNRAERDKTSLSLIVLDIDLFKNVNDTFGHMTGDAVLEDLAKFLVSNVRKMDIVCRYGGEEFVIVMPGASATTAAERAQALRQGIADKSFFVQDLETHLTCSFGICSFPELALTVDQLLSRADIAMYASKQAGRDHCFVWKPEMNLNTVMLPK